MTGARRRRIAGVVAIALAVIGLQAAPSAHAAASGWVEILGSTMREIDCNDANECQWYVTAGEPFSVDVYAYDDLGDPITGTVTLKDGAATISTADLDADGAATLSVDAGLSTPGAHTLAAFYDGNEDFTASPPNNAFVEVLPSPPVGGYQRIAGTTRAATAAEMARDVFRRTDFHRYALLVRSDDPADALCAGPYAASHAAALLLTGRDHLDTAARDELNRAPKPDAVIVIGGPGAISDTVVNEVRSLGFDTDRAAGQNRYDTCAQLSFFPQSPIALLANGTNAADALAASAAAAQIGAALLLTNGDSMPPESQAWIADNQPEQVIAIGGPASRAYPSAERVAGADRFETAALVAGKFFEHPAFVAVATGYTFADALAGGPHIFFRGRGPLLLVSSDLPPAVRDYLTSRKDSIIAAFVYGGTAAVSDQVAQQVASSL